MSASVRRSENACHRWARSAMTRRVSSVTGERGGAMGRTQAAGNSATARRRTALLRRKLRTLTLDPPETVPKLLDLLLHTVGARVKLQRPLPRGERVLVQAVLGVRIAQMVEDDGVGLLGLVGGALELAQRIGVTSLLVE